MLEKTYWRTRCGETVTLENFYLLIWYILYICCFFRFDASPKKLFVSCIYHILFVCLAPMVSEVNTENIQYFWIFLDTQIMQDSFCAAALTISFVSLILWLKAYVAFSDLQDLKILLCEYKMSFKIGSLMGVWNILRKLNIHPASSTHIHTHTHTHTHNCPSGGQHSVPNLEKGSEKMSAWRDLKSSFYR